MITFLSVLFPSTFYRPLNVLSLAYGGSTYQGATPANIAQCHLPFNGRRICGSLSGNVHDALVDLQVVGKYVSQIDVDPQLQ